MNTKTWMTMVAGLIFATACGSSTGSVDEFGAAVPSQDGMTMEVSNSPSEAATLDTAQVQSSAQALGSVDAGASGLIYLPKIREAIHSLNEGLRMAFGPVEALVVMDGKDLVKGESKQFGPFVQDGVQYLLTVKKLRGASDNHFFWVLQAKAATADANAPFVAFAAGTNNHLASDAPRRGRGTIGVDLDAYATVKAGFPGVGKLFAAFSHSGGGKTLVYALAGFSSDTTQFSPVSAIFEGHKINATGVTSVRVLDYGDIIQTPDAPLVNEFLLARARYNPGVGGRAEVVVFGGDAANTVYYGKECWDVAESLAFRAVFACTSGTPETGGACVKVEADSFGDIAACRVQLVQGENELTEGDRDSTSPAPDAPGAGDLPGLPDGMPTGD